MIVADEDHMPGKIIVGLLTIGFVALAGGEYQDLVMIEKAPKLYIIQEIGAQIRHSQCSTK